MIRPEAQNLGLLLADDVVRAGRHRHAALTTRQTKATEQPPPNIQAHAMKALAMTDATKVRGMTGHDMMDPGTTTAVIETIAEIVGKTSAGTMTVRSAVSAKMPNAIALKRNKSASSASAPKRGQNDSRQFWGAGSARR